MLLEEDGRNEIKDVRECYLNVRTVWEESETEGNSSYCTKNTSHMEAFGKKWYKLNPFTEIDFTRGFNSYHSVLERNLRGSCEGKGKCPQVMCDAGTNIE